MITATEFLSGTPAPDKLTVEWILHADDGSLERRHDWVQWAFPNVEPSAFNPDAPTTTPEEMQALPQVAKDNLLWLYMRYFRFLQATQHWRMANNHNHLRITRVLKCLMLAGFPAHAAKLYAFVVGKGANATSERFWRGALEVTP